MSIAVVDQRVAERARRRRTRHAMAAGALALAVLAVAGAIRMHDPGIGDRVFIGDKGGLIAPAALPKRLPDTDGEAQPTPDGTTMTDAATPATSVGSGTALAPVVEARPDRKPIGAQTPDPAKNAPAPPEPTANSGLTARGVSVASAPSDAVEVPPPSGRLDSMVGCGISTGPAGCPSRPVGPAVVGPATSPASVAPAKENTSTAASHVAPAGYGPAEPPQS